MTSEPVNLETCDREPIHIPGAIQPHGVLFSVRGPEMRVRQVSENVRAFFGVDATDVLDHPLGALFDDASAAFLSGVLASPSLRDVSPARVTSRSGAAFDAVLHRPTGPAETVVVELEPAGEQAPRESAASFDPRLRSGVVKMAQAITVQSLCDLAAAEVRAITGFDRVMVYRFDPDWNGEVVSEAKRDDLEPFLGQHYPASDIPAQARRLYTVNWLRFIGDVRYTPQRLVPAVDPDVGEPLDMSHCVLRSVSPIHVEYMKNMGVEASMSISLVDDGNLVGLIACHHYSGARVVPFAVRETAEFLGRTLSWHVRVLERAEVATRARGAQAHEAEVVRALAINPELLESLLSPAFVSLAGADGGAVVLAEGIRTIGEAPRESVLRALVEWLRTTEGDVFTTDTLPATFPDAPPELPGIVAVALSRELGEWLFWFRRPTERIIDWAGDPRKVVVPAEGEKPERLSPRGSFALWRETVRGKSLPWQSWQVDAASSLRRVLVGGLRQRANKLRELNERLVANDRARDEFIATVSHELRNPLSAITGWTRLLREGTLSVDRRAHAIEVIARNAAAQSQLIEDLLDVSRMTSGKLSLEVDTVDMVELVESAVEAVKVALESKEIRLKRILDTRATPVVGDALRLRQVITNLLNNAVKFTPKNGSITVLLQRIESDIELVVSDTGQGISPEFLPHMFELFRQEDAGMNRRSQGLGLGLTLVKRLVELHGGRVIAKSDGLGKGASFHVRLPMSAVRMTPVSAVEPPKTNEGDRSTPSNGLTLAGLSLLVVEDEPDARDLLRHVLESYGATVTTCPNALEGLLELSRTTFDVVISDVGMPEMDGFQFMRELRSRDAAQGGKTPAVALTAYTRTMDRTTALMAGFHAHVPKPVDATELVAVVSSLASRFGFGR